MAATVAIGFVSDAIQKIESGFIAICFSRS
jgi:hypothetical protein